MPFDGIEYQTVGLVAPQSHHPDALVAPPLVAQSLIAGYAYARQGGQLGVQAHQISVTRSGQYGVRSTSLIAVGEFFCHIPPAATHLVADLIYQIVSPSQADVSLQIETSSETGPTATTPMGYEASDDEVNGLTMPMQQAIVVMPIGTTPVGATTTMTVRAAATESETGNAVWLRPHLTVARWIAVG